MNLLRRCKHGLMIYNQKDIWVGRSLETYGEYSEKEVDLWRDLIHPGDSVVEVGANIGSLTLPLARLVGPQGSVIAFEPERTAFCALAGNIALNNLRNVFCFQQAVGDTNGVVNVPELDHDRTENWGGLSLDVDYSNCPHYPIAMNTLDNVMLNKCHFIKIDVEGMELQVLKGGIKTVEKHKPFLYIEDDRIEKSTALREFITSLDYEMLLHMPPLFSANNFDGESNNCFVGQGENGPSDIVSINLLCWPKDTPCPVKMEDFGLKVL